MQNLAILVFLVNNKVMLVPVYIFNSLEVCYIPTFITPSPVLIKSLFQMLEIVQYDFGFINFLKCYKTDYFILKH